MQPTTNETMEENTKIRLEKDSDAYISPTLSGIAGAGGLAHPATSHNLAEIVSQEYPPFEAETLIIRPIMDEESNDEKFYKELGEHLIESLLMFHAWAAARPRHEHNAVCEMISSKMSKIEETEKDQGRYHTTLCTEKPLPLSSFQSYYNFDGPSSEVVHETKCRPLGAHPHSPPPPDFVCSRSLEQNRRKLANFVEKMKNALASLTDSLGYI